MRLTRTHARWWALKRAPRWASELVPAYRPPTVHDCVNAHAGVGPNHLEMDAMVTYMRDERDMYGPAGTRQTLKAIRDSWRNKHYAAIAARWLKRLEAQRAA